MPGEISNCNFYYPLWSNCYPVSKGTHLMTSNQRVHPRKLILHDQVALLWRHNGCDGVSNHQPHDCSRNHSFRHRSKKRSKLHVTGLCAGDLPVTGEFPAQRASNAENISIWWRHHGAGKNVATKIPFPGSFAFSPYFWSMLSTEMAYVF